jgi:hypothetical protein
VSALRALAPTHPQAGAPRARVYYKVDLDVWWSLWHWAADHRGVQLRVSSALLNPRSGPYLEDAWMGITALLPGFVIVTSAATRLRPGRHAGCRPPTTNAVVAASVSVIVDFPDPSADLIVLIATRIPPTPGLGDGRKARPVR